MLLQNNKGLVSNVVDHGTALAALSSCATFMLKDSSLLSVLLI